MGISISENQIVQAILYALDSSIIPDGSLTSTEISKALKNAGQEIGLFKLNKAIVALLESDVITVVMSPRRNRVGSVSRVPAYCVKPKDGNDVEG